MKALVYNKKALPGKLTFCEIEKPIPNENEVLVKVQAVSLNAADYRSMRMGLIPKKKIFGADIAGRVESVGKNILKFKPGDEVIGDLADYGFGGLAEYALAPEKALIFKPVDLSFEDASALPMAAVTALQALKNKGCIQKGHQVLIIGSGGGVGTFAVQLAKFFGATVTAICSSDNIGLSQSLGADHVIDYTKENFLKNGKSYDLIVAVNGNYPLSACKRILNPKGIYVMVGGGFPQIFKSLLFGWLMSFGAKKIRSLAAKSNAEDLEFIVSLVNDKKIRPVIDKCFSLDRSAEAMKYLSEGHAKGKVVITVP